MGLFDTLAQLEKAQEEEVIRVAGESIKREVEKEYCVWVKPTQAGWDWLHAQSTKMFMDILMPIEGGRRRIRIKEDGTAQLTLKRKFLDGKVEENSDIGISSALSFYKDGYLAHLVKRIHLEPGELADKGAKHWDIDIFSITTGHPAIEVSGDFNDLLTEMRSSTSVVRCSRRSICARAVQLRTALIASTASGINVTAIVSGCSFFHFLMASSLCNDFSRGRKSPLFIT